MSIMICDKCDTQVDTDYYPMTQVGDDVVCDSCLGDEQEDAEYQANIVNQDR